MLAAALRLAATRTQQPPLYANPSSPHLLRGRKPCEVSLRRVFTAAAATPDDMQKRNDAVEKPAQTPLPGAAPLSKHGDSMSSFGEGYATRSDEEGFGGIYGGNNEEEDKIIQENAAEYGNNQGSEVKEKEKGRNQPHASS